MPTYSGEPDYQHGSPERLGVLLVNLGTPDNPRPAAVRRFLAQFLWDPRVVEAPRWLWWLVLHGAILRIRPSRSAHAYQQIWTEQGSPLLLHSQALTRALATRFASANVEMALGMTYGSPSIPDALAALRARHVRRLIVLPLYPQYSATTTASVFDQVTEELQRWRWIPEVRFVNSYHDDPAYIEALAESIRQHWRTHGQGHLLFSFHGIPRRYLLAGDPYHCQSVKTARLVIERLQLDAAACSISFQSQVGREEWLRPYTDQRLLELAKSGTPHVNVICPGFAADCLETLEEIALRNREHFLKAGGKQYDYVPALNASADHVELLAGVIERHAQGWPSPREARVEPQSRERALRAGAER